MLRRTRKGLDDRASDYTDADLIAAMQTAWRWHLPSKIDGTFSDGWLSLPLVAGQTVYLLDSAASVPWPGQLLVLKQIWLVSDLILHTIYTDRQAYDFAKEAKSVLLQDRALYFRTVPTAGQTATLQGRVRGPTINTNTLDPENGIVNDVHAIAVTRGAVVDIASQEGWSDIVAEYAPMYDASIKTIQALSLNDPWQPPNARPDL
jgi:hypothetical protein